MKHIIFLVFTLLLFSCKTETCDGTIYKNGITYKNGKKYSGKCITHWQDFSTRSIKQYKDGLDHGKWVFYYQNGNMQTEGFFEKGKRSGTWSYFYESGQLWKQHFYDTQGIPKGNWFTYNLEGQKVDSVLH